MIKDLLFLMICLGVQNKNPRVLKKAENYEEGVKGIG